MSFVYDSQPLFFRSDNLFEQLLVLSASLEIMFCQPVLWYMSLDHLPQMQFIGTDRPV